MTTDATALNAQAAALEEEARRHKRASSFHRRQSREKMQELALVRERLASLGIDVEITQSKETQ
jgi:hypothetical protein